MTAAALLRRLANIGAEAVLDGAGAVRIRPASAVPPDLMADLRQHRDEIGAALRPAFYMRFMQEAAAALAAPDPDLDAERAVMAGHYAEPTSVHPHDRADATSGRQRADARTHQQHMRTPADG